MTDSTEMRDTIQENAVDISTAATVGALDSSIKGNIAERYQILREIGRGGMGAVYLALDVKLNRHVAIKRLIIPEKSNIRNVQRRFLREAQTIASLGHANIVNVYDINRDDFGTYICMEYVPGPVLSDADQELTPKPPADLERYVKLKGPMEAGAAKDLIVKLCRAMDYAHNQGIIHRDIKPSNILLTPGMEPKLADFGLARPMSTSKTEEITLYGTTLGTPDYAAPEQWNDATEADARSDVFSLGGVLWFILTGTAPRYFRGQSLAQLLQQAIGRALELNPDDRFQTVKEFERAMRDVGMLETGVFILPGSSTSPESAISWQCGNCTFLNKADALYCVHCGTCGMSTCPMCEVEFRIGLKFCPNCGRDVQDAEGVVSSLIQARCRAELMEFYGALSSLSSVDTEFHEDVAEMKETLKANIAERIGTLQKLTEALDVGDADAAVEAARALNEMIPQDCALDSADMRDVNTFVALVRDLRKILCDRARDARAAHDLGAYVDNVQLLNDAFGAEACVQINDELADTSYDIEQRLTQAGLAVGMNCFSTALEILLGVLPWHGADLGERRERMIESCSATVGDRKIVLDRIAASLEVDDCLGAIDSLFAIDPFRLKPQSGKFEIDFGDLHGQHMIADLEQLLNKKIAGKIPQWIESESWLHIQAVAESIKRGGTSHSWQNLADAFTDAIREATAALYHAARELESSSKFDEAETAWEKLASMPGSIVPGELQEFASKFSRRRFSKTTARRERIQRRLSFVFVLAWIYPLTMVSMGIYHAPPASLDPAVLMVEWGAGVGNFLIFLIALLLMAGKRWVGDEHAQVNGRPSVRDGMFYFIAAVSPLSYLVYCLTSRVWLYIASAHAALAGLVAVLILWVIADIVRRTRFRLPGMMALSLSWTLILTLLYPALRENPAVFWPAAAVVHAIAFGLIEAVDAFVNESGNRKSSVVRELPSITFE